MTTVSKANRFVGYLIDGLIGCSLSFICGFISGLTGLGFLSVIGSLLCLAYFLLRDALNGGQSIGKKVMKYKVMKADGSSLAGDFKTSVFRNLSLMIPFVDAIRVLIDKPRLGDEWAKTSVVSQ